MVAKALSTNGDMSGGFALLAFPAKYASSGVMTLVVNQDNVAYKKDLGPQTPTLALRITEYNPDESWSEVRRPESDFPEKRAIKLRLGSEVDPDLNSAFDTSSVLYSCNADTALPGSRRA